MKRMAYIALVPMLTFGVSTAPSSEPLDYLDIVRNYANAMIEHGQDQYGEIHSPLLAEALDRQTMRLLQGENLQKVASLPRQVWGIRPHDRMITGQRQGGAQLHAVQIQAPGLATDAPHQFPRSIAVRVDRQQRALHAPEWTGRNIGGRHCG